MKLIFLGIDGVLNCIHLRNVVISGFMGRELSALISPERVARLNRLVHVTGAQVVLSSQWREIFGLERTQAALDDQGADFTLVGHTPVLPSGDRAKEIQAFLDGFGSTLVKYAVLDDNWRVRAVHQYRFVYVPDGLDDVHVERAMRVLGVS
jgi:hypothetical protein